MKIAFVAASGSPIGVIPPDVYERGVGGAELALVSLTEMLAKRRHNVVVYNNPKIPGVYDGVKYDHLHHFKEDYLDAVVLFRNPWRNIEGIKCPVIFWSCDQQTEGDYSDNVFPYVDHTVCISPYHRDYHMKRYGVENGDISYIDLGVRLQDYDYRVQKVKGRCIYCSQPDRGLDILWNMWPIIKTQVPHASLVITADRTLWGVNYTGSGPYQEMWDYLKDPGVAYLGNIPRDELCREQLKAEVATYPGNYEELFCISMAECQVAGAVPVTSGYGSLPTTVDAGVVLDGHPRSPGFLSNFIAETVDLLTNDERRKKLQFAGRRTQARFDWGRIAGEWESLIRNLG